MVIMSVKLVERGTIVNLFSQVFLKYTANTNWFRIQYSH